MRTSFIRRQVYRQLSVPLLMIGYGAVGRGVLPLLERHFSWQKNQMNFIEPCGKQRFPALKERGYSNFMDYHLTDKNYVETITKVFGSPVSDDDSVRGIIVNCSVDTCSLDIMKLCRKLGVLYIDTVVEPWAGLYDDRELTSEERTNYILRQAVRDEKAANPGGFTAVSCCGANPGFVSWALKEGLLKLGSDLGETVAEPKTQQEWAAYMQRLGVRGLHIAERDTQFGKDSRPPGVFRNTWSVDGFISEGFHQPSELGWGTGEKWFPPRGKQMTFGCKASILMEQPGAATRVRSWCPTLGAQYGFLVTHNEAISIADYFTLRDKDGKVLYRPTCHYAYHPCDDAVLSLHECFGANKLQSSHHVMTEKDIGGGHDELGVLIYGHKRNAMWYGSTLTHQETLRVAPEQNATILQVTSAMLAGLVWALENPKAGIVESDEMDFRRCLEVQRPYLGRVWASYTDWTPLAAAVPSELNSGMFLTQNVDTSDPWSFQNVLVDV